MYEVLLFKFRHHLLSIYLVEDKFPDHVSYSVPRPIHRPMHRSIYRSLLDRLSTDTRLTSRSTVDRESTDVSVELPLMSAEVSTVTISGAYRSTTGGISVNYRRNVCRIIIQQSSESLPILCADLSNDTIDQYIDLYQILSTHISTATIDRYQILSTDVSTDISTDTRSYPPIYRPIPDTID